MKKEDDAFYRHLPKDPRRREQMIGQYLARPQQERLLDGWKRSYESKAKPKVFKLKAGLNPTGRWQRARGPLGAALQISPLGGRYTVNFVTWDPQGSIVFHRTGDLQVNQLVLDRPVFDNVDHPFSKLYVLDMGKSVSLIPSSDVELFERLMKQNRNRPQVIGGLTFGRIKPARSGVK